MSTILGRAKFRGRPLGKASAPGGGDRCAIFVIATLTLHWRRIEKETGRRVIWHWLSRIQAALQSSASGDGASRWSQPNRLRAMGHGKIRLESSAKWGWSFT